MSKNKVISRKNIPVNFPTTFTIVLYLLIDKFSIGGIWLGAIITVMVIYWIGALMIIIKSEYVELFESKEK